MRVEDARERAGVGIGDHDLGPVVEQVLHEMAADLAHAGDPDGATAQGGCAPRGLRGGAHALEHAVRREDRGVPGTSLTHGAPGDEAALLRDHVHVLGVGADVAGGVVATVERLHEPAVRAQQVRSLLGERVADDHRLAAAQVQARDRGLVGHAAGQVEHVPQGGGRVRVGVEPGPAEGGSASGRMDGDQGPQAGTPVVAVHDLLVVVTSAGRGLRLELDYDGGLSCELSHLG